MIKSSVPRRNVLLALAIAAIVLGGYWLLPINGQVVVIPGATNSLVMPQMYVEPSPTGAATLWVTDVVPWAHVEVTLNGETIPLKDYVTNPGGSWTWRWAVPANRNGPLVFYHDCHSGCIERGRLSLGQAQAAAPTTATPTKLGVVFANPNRDWHGRSGWDVELTYARLADKEHWGVDSLAARVQHAAAQGLRVLVRVDYAQGQSVPPTNDHIALTEYLQYLQRLARDDRLQPVYGYIIGSSYNARDSNLFAPDRPVTPAWYARVFNGFGEAVNHTDNALQVIRAQDPSARVLVGPLQPWNREQSGDQPYAINVPWLNYMNTLVASLNAGAQEKSAVGISSMAPDGFAVQAPGRPDAPELQDRSPADEPRAELSRAEWGGAQAGFRVYRDWMVVINAYPTTRGLPIFITSSNTFTPDQATVPAQNYPRGWLSAALDVVNREPQIEAFCWFLDDDRSGDTRWDLFSLSQHAGRMVDAADEFDALLR